MGGMSIQMRRRAVLVAGCAAVLLGGQVTAARAGGGDPLSSAALMRDVRAYASLGPLGHWVGTASSERTLAWIRGVFAASGIRNGVDGVSFYAFRPRRWGLTIGGRRLPRTAPYFYSGSTGPTARVARLAYAGEGTAGDLAGTNVKGKIAVIDVPYLEDFLDPTFTGEGAAGGAFAAIAKAGAVGLVAVTEGPQDYPVNQDVSSTLGLKSLPTLFVGKRSGATVIAAAKAGRRASLLLDADPGRACAQNVWGILPGRDRTRYVVIASPTSGFDQAASERGAGDAILLGLARHYASLPVSRRPVTLVIAALSGHEVGVGIPTFAQMHPQWFGQRTDAYIGLGASIAAIQEQERPDGSVQSYPFGDLSRDLYVSENPLLEPIVQRNFAAAQPLGSIPPSAFDPGEQSVPYALGIPIVAISGASYYFHTAGDTPAGVSPSLLAASATAFEQTIDEIAGMAPGSLRSANVMAHTLAGEGAAGKPQRASAPAGNPGDAAVPAAGCATIATRARVRHRRRGHARRRRGRRRR